MKIGKYTVTGAVLAPMAGFTDVAFRELAVECGAAFTVTEMVSVRGLLHGSAATGTLMRISEIEKPSCVQLFGSDPDDFARAAAMVNSDVIDVNMGCPMPKIVKNGDGAALLNDPDRAGRIVRALVNATDKPITVKTRLGYKTGEPRVRELIESVAKSGAAAVTVHGRYAEQRYTGEADSAIAADIARHTDIPVIVNGDLSSAEAQAPFAAVMIGRAALKEPSVFCGGKSDPFDIARRHIALLKKYFDDRYTVNQCRKFFVHYFAGIRGGKALRAAANAAETPDDILRAVDRHEKSERSDK